VDHRVLHPHLLTNALSLMRVWPSAGVMIDDSNTDLEASVVMGMPVFGYG
jgi:beta-phosphoglucomutase-like phosphatase (HAD superfamily)